MQFTRLEGVDAAVIVVECRDCTDEFRRVCGWSGGRHVDER